MFFESFCRGGKSVLLKVVQVGLVQSRCAVGAKVGDGVRGVKGFGSWG